MQRKLRIWSSFSCSDNRKSAIQNPKWLGLSVIACVLVVVEAAAQAQQPAGKIPRIGYLATASRATELPYIEAFRLGLHELGYVEGKNIHIEYRYAEGRFERLQELAEELVRLKVEILVVPSATAARAAKKSNVTIPIVMSRSGDPFSSGLVASLARPGGNVTGLYQYSPELLGKRLELLNEVVPKISRFAFLSNSVSMFKKAQVDAEALGIRLQLVEVKDPTPDFEGAFQVIIKERIGALVTEATPLFSAHRKRILALVELNRIPAMHSEQEWATAGGLMSYGSNRVDLSRRAATYVDKILKGAKPADLPVEQPTKFEFVINLKTAKVLNLTIPQSVLYRADKVIR